MKKNELLEAAKGLAAQEYAIRITRDKTTDGEDIFMASNPELEGCMAQGETIEDAQSLLKEVRIDYMAHLLEHRLPIPAPRITITGDRAGIYTTVFNDNISGIGIPPEGPDSVMDAAIQPKGREILLEAQLKT